MRLADFITTHSESIIAEWVKFAASSGPAGKTMNVVELRDHAADMLRVIVADLQTPQTGAEQEEKGKGNSDAEGEDADTAAEVHGAGRAESGFSLGEMVAEYRALRASVIRLWTKANGKLVGADLEDLMRFNEAIDQALAESVTRYAKQIDHSKEMFVAILGHDLRTPLDAVVMSSQFMLDVGDMKGEQLTLTTQIARSARRMSDMVNDLLDFTTSRLGSGLPIERAPMDLAAVAHHAVEEMEAAHPDSVLQLQTAGDLTGDWDETRVGQMLTNLLTNAVQHGTGKSTISVTVQGQRDEIVLRVHNRGAAIPANELPEIFSPLKRLRSGARAAPGSRNLGLGLYIVERIVVAHDGTIDVTSSGGAGTLFTVRLPRVAAEKAGDAAAGDAPAPHDAR